MAITVSKNVNSTTSGQTASRSATFSGTVATTGTVIVCVVSVNQVTAVTDNKGNTYTKDVALQAAGVCMSWWRTQPSTGGTNFTITATMATSASIWFSAQEVTGRLFMVNEFHTSGTSATPGPGIVRTYMDDVFSVLACCVGIGSTSFRAAPTNWDQRLNYNGSSNALGGQVRTRTFATPTTNTPTWTLNVQRGWVAGAITYGVGVTASFTGTPTSGAAPLTVTFTDASTGSPTYWLWDYGDGQTFLTFTSQNPSHDYAANGAYTVKLTVGRHGSTSTQTRTDYIVVGGGASVTPPGPPVEAIEGEPGFLVPVDDSGLSLWVPIGDDWFPVPEEEFIPPPDPDAPETEPPLFLFPDLPDPLDRERLRRSIQQLIDMLNSMSRQQFFVPGDEAGNFRVRGAGFRYQRVPGVNDDSTIGASPGASWINDADSAAPQVWVCTSATAGEASWVRLKIVTSDMPTFPTGVF